MSIGIECQTATTASEPIAELRKRYPAKPEAEIMQCLREQRPLDDDQVSRIKWAFERKQALQSEVDALKRERRIHFGVPPDEDLPDGAEEDLGRYIRLRKRVDRLLNNNQITERWADIIYGRSDITGPEVKELVDAFGLAYLPLDPELASGLTGFDFEVAHAESIVNAIEGALDNQEDFRLN